MTQLNPLVLPPNATSPPGRPLKPYRSRRIQPTGEHGHTTPQQPSKQQNNPEEDQGEQHIDIEV